MLLGLAALWGASFMFIKVGDRQLHPITLVGFRMALGALTLVVVKIGVRRALRELRAAARPLVVTGLLNSAIPIFAISWAETRIDSGLTAIIQASAPLFAALLALRFSRDERVSGSRLGGLIVGLAGVALLVGAQPRGQILAGLAVVFAAVCYAAAALYTGRRLRHTSPLLTSAGAHLVPVFALFYCAVLLGEPVTAAGVGGLALVLAGVALGSGALRLGRARRATVVGG